MAGWARPWSTEAVCWSTCPACGWSGSRASPCSPRCWVMRAGGRAPGWCSSAPIASWPPRWTRSRVTQAVPLAADLQAALQRVQCRPERVRRFRDLPPEPAAPRAARALVRRACVDWDVPRETENAAALVISELTANAVVHAGTPLRVCLVRKQREESHGPCRTVVGARNAAHVMRPADTRGAVHRAGRAVGRLFVALVVGWGVVVGERPGRGSGVADGCCSGAGTRRARWRRAAG